MKILFSILLILFVVFPTNIGISSEEQTSQTKPAGDVSSKLDKIYAEATREIDTAFESDFRIDESEYRKLQEENRIKLLIGIMILTCISLLMILVCMIRNEKCAPWNIVNASGLVLVIQATLFIVVASDTHEQLTAAIGVVGAIAGYLFGSASRGPVERKDEGVPANTAA